MEISVRFALVNAKGIQLTEPDYDKINLSDEGIHVFLRRFSYENLRAGLLGPDGKELWSLRCKRIAVMKEGLVRVRLENNQDGYMDRQGTQYWEE